MVTVLVCRSLRLPLLLPGDESGDEPDEPGDEEVELLDESVDLELLDEPGEEEDALLDEGEPDGDDWDDCDR